MIGETYKTHFYCDKCDTTIKEWEISSCGGDYIICSKCGIKLNLVIADNEEEPTSVLVIV